MKLFKITALAFALIATVSCKQTQSDTEVVTIDNQESTAKTINENAPLATTTMTIEGMTCVIGCASKIEKSLQKMDGVASATIDFETKTATVKHDANTVTTEMLAEMVAKNGDMYSVATIDTEAKKECASKKKACCKETAEKKCASKSSKECNAKKKSCSTKKECTSKKDSANKCKKDCKEKCCKA